MKITRSNPKTHYVKVPNATARDRRLSWKARGLLAYLLSHADGNGPSDADELAEEAPDGRTAVRTGLNELVKFGYVQRHKRQDERGQWSTEVEVFDTPQPVKPKSGFPTSGKPPSGHRTSGHRQSENLTLRAEDHLEDQGEDHQEEQDQKLPPLPPDADPDDRAASGEEPGGTTMSAAEGRTLAAELVATYKHLLTRTEQGTLTRSVRLALGRGWLLTDLAAELAKPTAGLNHVPTGLISRIDKLGEPPALVDATPCPLHIDYQTGQPYPALNCDHCWSEAKAFFDPFKGQHQDRHPGWPARYNFDPPATEPEKPMSAEEIADMMARMAELDALLPDVDDETEVTQ